MKSICIKTNNIKTIDYLLKMLDDIELENICFSSHTFNHYENVIIHYTGSSFDAFISNIAELLSFIVIDIYEDNILKKVLSTDYFYFDNQEQEEILEICTELLADSNFSPFDDRYILLFNCFYNYIFENNRVILEGVINFRLKTYMSFLDSIIDTAVNRFIVEREYWEFISLLKVYINSEISSAKCVHLIYCDEHSILLDQDKNIIDTNTDVFKAKYLSDITFSSNDYALNTLLNILPKKIYVHLSQQSIDEFINTLLLVFEHRIEICNDCELCQMKHQKSSHQ